MSLLDQATAVEPITRPSGPQQVTRTMEIDMDELRDLVAALEAQYPHMELHEAPIRKNGLAPTGEKMVPFAGKTQKGTVVVYYTGKVVLSGEFAKFEG
jgi:hypothetical protein